MNRRDVLAGAAVGATASTHMVAQGAMAQDRTAGQASPPIELETSGAVLVLRIAVPPNNPVIPDVLRAIDDVLSGEAQTDEVGAIVITGADGTFSSGAGNTDPRDTPTGEPTQSFLARELYRRIEGYPKPIIAAVTGLCQGGGNELAMACDIRIAGTGAQFRQPEIRAGVTPGFGGMQRLPRLVGLGRAMEIMLSGRIVEPNEALRIGLVTEVVSDASLERRATEIGQGLADGLNKPALAVFKERMAISYDEPFGTALRNDQLAFDRVAGTDEARRAVDRFLSDQ